MRGHKGELVLNGELPKGNLGLDMARWGIECHSFVRIWKLSASQNVVGGLHPPWLPLPREAILGLEGEILCKALPEGIHA